MQQPVNLKEKRLEMQDNRHTRMPLKVVESCTTRSANHARTRTWIHCWHILCTNIITLTHAINSSTKLLSIDSTKTRILRWQRVEETEIKKNKTRKKGGNKRKEKKRKLKEERKKEENKWINNLKINKTEVIDKN